MKLSQIFHSKFHCMKPQIVPAYNKHWHSFNKKYYQTFRDLIENKTYLNFFFYSKDLTIKVPCT